MRSLPSYQDWCQPNSEATKIMISQMFRFRGYAISLVWVWSFQITFTVTTQEWVTQVLDLRSASNLSPNRIFTTIFWAIDYYVGYSNTSRRPTFSGACQKTVLTCSGYYSTTLQGDETWYQGAAPSCGGNQIGSQRSIINSIGQGYRCESLDCFSANLNQIRSSIQSSLQASVSIYLFLYW